MAEWRVTIRPYVNNEIRLGAVKFLVYGPDGSFSSATQESANLCHL